jgi:hypothetical protein
LVNVIVRLDLRRNDTPKKFDMDKGGYACGNMLNLEFFELIVFSKKKKNTVLM